MRKALLAIGALALTVAIVIGVIQAGDNPATKAAGPLTRAQVAAPVPGAPPRLAALRRQLNARLDGGKKNLDAQLRGLRGYPVVVNMWASWCGPCEAELPFLQRETRKRGAQVAFLGVNVDDSTANARELAAKYPMPYPSVVDPDSEIVRSYGGRGLPVTVFYDAKGEQQFVHQGVFASEQLLSDAIDRYALRR
jgi:thiol-disulfide isomerase/thioredoxin